MAARPLIIPFRGPWRRVVYVGVYEALAILLVTVALTWTQHDAGAAGATAVGSSAIAVAWNWVYNTFFERWEARQHTHGRSLLRRIVHGVGFEAGLSVFLIPFMAWMLGVGLLRALVLDFSLLVFFLVYTVVFTWVFDRLFGLPASAM